jgi:UDP-GlcNAc:undecaprenyl-phosphate/decaprenyl-phosphate GlcNAc-1-phosphate transferase
VIEHLAPLAIAAAVAAALAPGALRGLAGAGHTRENFRGRRVAFPAGTIAVAAALLALAPIAAAQEIFGWQLLADPPGGDAQVLDNAPWTLALPLGVAFLGLLDDALDAPARGWRGHGRALVRGELSTGALKAFGTLALAFAVLAQSAERGWSLVLSALLIAATTNLFNLLDLRPGRAAKSFVLLGAGLLLFTGTTEPLRAVGPFLGPLLVLGLYDLRERAMLGDTGSNVLGVLAGLWLVLVLGDVGELVALAVVLALTVYGEMRSITRAIERIPPLRWLDELGRPQDAA